MILRTARYLWVFYAIIIFVISLLVSYPVYLFYFIFYPKKSADRSVYPFTRLWGHYLAFIFFVRLKKHRSFKPDKNKQYIYVANHRSMLDIPFTAALIPGHFRFLAKNSLLKVPLLGRIIKGICITVDRKNMVDKSMSYVKMKQTLEEGSSVLIFPEGTRVHSKLTPEKFQNGAFKLALETQVPIVILTLWETSSILYKNKFWEMKPGKVDCFVSAPVEPTGTIEELKNKAYQIMEKNINSVRKKQSNE